MIDVVLNYLIIKILDIVKYELNSEKLTLFFCVDQWVII